MKRFLSQLWAFMAPTAPSPEVLALQHLEDARRDLLTAESRLEECQAAVAAYNARIARLRIRVQEDQS